MTEQKQLNCYYAFIRSWDKHWFNVKGGVMKQTYRTAIICNKIASLDAKFIYHKKVFLFSSEESNHKHNVDWSFLAPNAVTWNPQEISKQVRAKWKLKNYKNWGRKKKALENFTFLLMFFGSWERKCYFKMFSAARRETGFSFLIGNLRFKKNHM